MTPISRLKAKLSSIADAIREKTGSTDLMTLDEMAENIEFMNPSTEEESTYILVDESGYEMAAVLVDEEVELTATVNDIRIGTTAVTNDGVVEGEKEIPAYITTEGRTIISPGDTIAINTYNDNCQYTRLQALVCSYNTSLNNSVSTVMVVIGDSVYDVMSTTVKASVTVDIDNKSINLGLTNDSDDYLVVRYFTYRED